VGVIGPKLDLTYRHQHLGESASVLAAIAAGTHDFAQILKSAKHPMLILGMGALTRPDGGAILAAARKIADSSNMVREDWNGFNLLHTAAARVGALDLRFLPGKGGQGTEGILAGAASGAIDTVYLLGADEIDMSRLGKAFVIYQGHHGDKGAARADIVLPGAAYTEKNATYVNMEGRAQFGRMAVFPPGDAREDWKILRALSASLGKPLPFDSLGQLRHRLHDGKACFGAIDHVVKAEWGAFGKEGAIDAAPFRAPIENFYMTDPISRASETMAKCTDLYLHGKEPVDNQELTGTYG